MARPRTLHLGKRLRGFTLVELLVVIGIIAVLIGILLPSLSAAREQAKVTQCISNMRELTKCWMMYADEKKGVVCSPNTGPDQWVDSGDTPQAMQNGIFWPYIKNLAVFKCPSDTMDRARSYSINDYWNGSWPTFKHAKKIQQVRNTPDVFVFIEEWDFRGYNEGSYVCEPYPSWTWTDYPAIWHTRGSSLSFADGHAEYWRWSDPRTLTIKTNYMVTANNADLRRLQGAIGFSPPH